MKIASGAHNRLILLAGLIFLTSLLLETGGLGDIDSLRRLQVTHSFWTSAPAVIPSDFPVFGLVGRNGTIQAWYGMGQSVVMLPGDIVGTAVTRLLHISGPMREKARVFIVAILTFPAIATADFLLAYALVGELGFSARQAIVASMGFFFATTFLYYVHIHMENSLIVLCVLLCYRATFRWLRSAKPSWLAVAAAAAGFNLLVRLTTALELFPLAILVGYRFWALFDSRARRRLAVQMITIALPIALLAGIVDRAYQFHRFGTVRGTYISVQQEQYSKRFPDLNPLYPWGNPFESGFVGPLFTLHKSVFLYDPLLLLVIAMVCFGSMGASREVRLMLAALLAGLILNVWLHARLINWHGDDAWGDRYVITPVQIASLIAMAVLARNFTRWSRPLKAIAVACILISLASQCESLIFPATLEKLYDSCTGQPPRPQIQRLENIYYALHGALDRRIAQTSKSAALERVAHPQFAVFAFTYGKSGILVQIVRLAWFMMLLLTLAAIARIVISQAASEAAAEAPSLRHRSTRQPAISPPAPRQ